MFTFHRWKWTYLEIFKTVWRTQSAEKSTESTFSVIISQTYIHITIRNRIPYSTCSKTHSDLWAHAHLQPAISIMGKIKFNPSKVMKIWNNITVIIDGRGAPVKCSITSQLDLRTGVCGVLGVFGECGCELGVGALELISRSSNNSTAGLTLSILVTCCRRLAHRLVLLTDPVIVLVPSSPWKFHQWLYKTHDLEQCVTRV